MSPRRRQNIRTRTVDRINRCDEAQRGEGRDGCATCCCHQHRLYYIGMAANRYRYKHTARQLINMIMAGGKRREWYMGCDMGYHCIRVTTRSGDLSSSGPLVCHRYAHRNARTETHTHTRVFAHYVCVRTRAPRVHCFSILLHEVRSEAENPLLDLIMPSIKMSLSSC